jgi:alpha 1,2-mannosyltransferase
LTVPTLWNSVKDFIKKYPEHIIDFYGDDSLIDWITDDRGVSYNKCYFWSNFEIGSLEWFRSKQYIDFFNHIDKAGGFYYER